MEFIKFWELFSLFSFVHLSTSAAWMVFEFEPIIWQRSLDYITPLQTHTVFSAIECADLCYRNSYCKSFSVDCQTLTSGINGDCFLFTMVVQSVDSLNPSLHCYVQRKGFSSSFAESAASLTVATTQAPTTTTTATTAVPVSTTPTTNTSNTINFLQVIYGPINMCSESPSSQKDFVVVAEDGIYIYDEVDDLTIAPCKGPLVFNGIFKEYGVLTDVSQVAAVLIYQNNVELYSNDNKVFQWQMNSAELIRTRSITCTSLLSLSENAALKTQTPLWGAYRNYMGAERHFYLGNKEFFMKSDQFGERRFQQHEPVINANNFNMNPWSDIPDDIVAACGYASEFSKNYVLIDNNLHVYTYELVHSPDNNNPNKILTPKGILKFNSSET